MPKRDSDKQKRGRGRPVKYPMPERIDATPEEIADVVMRMPYKANWQYLKKRDCAKA
jgi:hypothetical protein